MAHSVRDNPSRHRFELEAEGHTAFVEYSLAPGTITFMHTSVPQELSGRGIGSALARGALEAVQQRGLRVTAQCPFIAGYIRKHPAFQALLAVNE